VTDLDPDLLREKYNLTFQPYALEAERRIGLRGKDVLEVGGTLPRDFVLEDLGARRWVGIEYVGCYEDTGQRRDTGSFLTFEEVEDGAALGDHAVLSGRIERLPAVLHGRFDAVFSIATFEHIDRMPLALEKMCAALKPGGRLFSLFAPIWSSHDGHHLHDITDRRGNLFNKKKSPIPPWGHLLLTPPEMYSHLRSQTDPETAAEIVYQVYQSTSINRLFPEDYVRYFHGSQFQIDQILAVFPADVPEKLEQKLLQLYPRNRNFSNNGILAVFSRPESQ
jgi:SAM-dependent methyltransferase